MIPTLITTALTATAAVAAGTGCLRFVLRGGGV